MERSVEEAMQRVRIVYEMVTGKPAPEVSPDNPYARIPPEVDREEHVLRQAAALFERVRGIEQKKDGIPQFGSDVASPQVQPFGRGTGTAPIGMYREGGELRLVFDVGPVSREHICVELQGAALRVSSDEQNRSSSERDKQGEVVETAERTRVTQTAFLPARVDPSAVTADFTDGFLTIRVRMPQIDDAIHKIEIR